MSDDPLPALTPDQMSQVDRLMASEFGVGTRQLMEVAGQAVAAWARERLLGGDARAKQVVVLAGSGDNGGDGMGAARLLHAWGARPVVWLSHGVDRLAAATAHPAPLLAVDLPSGFDARTGEPYAPCIRVAATLTLALPKTGLLAPAARPFTGELAVADTGIPPRVFGRVGAEVGPLFAQQSIVRIREAQPT